MILMDYNPLNKIKTYEFKEMKGRKQGRKRETGREREGRALLRSKTSTNIYGMVDAIRITHGCSN